MESVTEKPLLKRDGKRRGKHEPHSVTESVPEVEEYRDRGNSRGSDTPPSATPPPTRRATRKSNNHVTPDPETNRRHRRILYRSRAVEA